MSNMSLLPYLINFNNPVRRNRSQQMLAVISPTGEVSFVTAPQQPSRSGTSLAHIIPTSITGRETFQINLDVQHFALEEISVKISDGFLIIEAGHDEKQDEHGWIKRFFTRRYKLPEGCNIDALESSLSSDGVLTVTAPTEVCRYERIVPVIQTGPVRTQEKLQIGDGETTEAVAATVL